ncbi:related to S-M checkpoint control protein rad4 [Cephalotrichum gorgonifer]|uniref:Related to S-M checkpoint control protein rad4 n=1 Tax=Cephalotrichum gorgonifer TaxID=2041049 RepID=A0AAE8SVR5_9PEZI|nr:related to S-M checkpoint control protein rad4 [Cephalotrichum gorgonifer]
MDTDDLGHLSPAFDPSQPLKGVVICCTSIPPNETKDIEAKTINLGGVYTNDLTVDVTHLLVGDYETAKYRHAAKALAHTKAMDAGWIEAITDLWREDAPIEFSALEKEWQLRPLEISGTPAPTPDNPNPGRGRLLVCLTGFLNLEERSTLQERITSNGGDYSGELNKKCTHLIVAKPEGQKYLAARKWNLKVVSQEWLDQTVDRGMILDEKHFDPLLPVEERGKGARDSPELALGKRQRLLDSFTEAEGPKRKLRKTASIKLSSQRENLFSDILGMKASTADNAETSPDDDELAPNPGPDRDTRTVAASFKDGGVFSTSSFYVQDFEPRKREILAQTITALGGRMCSTLDELHLSRAPLNPWHRFVVVPQDSHATPAPPPPNATASAEIVTEFFIERCLREKKFRHPRDHVLGRPFPVHPIAGFEGLTICSAGFTGIDLHHLDRAVRQLGARFEERFRRQTSLLICKSLGLVRKEKLRIALENEIPVLGEAWLWECVETGTCVGFEKHMFPELKQRASAKQRVAPSSRGNPFQAAREAFELDRTAFTPEAAAGGAPPKGGKVAGVTSDPSTRFYTARTQIFDNLDDFSSTRSKPKEAGSRVVPRAESPAPIQPPDAGLPPTAKQHDDGILADDQQEEEERHRRETELEERREKEEEEARKREEASRRKEHELLAFSTKLTSLIDPDANPAISDPAVEPRRRRGILGRATSNVSAPGSILDLQQSASVSDRLSGSLDRHSAPGDWEAGEEGEGAGLDGEGHSLLTQVGYADPEAAEARERIMGRLREDGGRRVKTR